MEQECKNWDAGGAALREGGARRAEQRERALAPQPTPARLTPAAGSPPLVPAARGGEPLARAPVGGPANLLRNLCGIAFLGKLGGEGGKLRNSKLDTLDLPPYDRIGSGRPARTAAGTTFTVCGSVCPPAAQLLLLVRPGEEAPDGDEQK